MNRINNEINLALFISGKRGQVVFSKLLENNFNILKIVVQKKSDLDDAELFSIPELAINENVNSNSFIDEMKKLNIDYFILSGFRQIMKK